MKNKTYFIIGAEGVGKSSILNKLKQKFPKIDIHDFDEVGVPLNPSLKWRFNTTLFWLKKAIENQNTNIQTCILGLCFPEEIKSFKEFKELKNVSFCLLDVNEKEREKRLVKRNDSKDVINDTDNLIKLRKQIKGVEGNIIDTSNLSIDETFKKVIKFLDELKC